MAYESVRERPHAPFVEMGRREAVEHARWFASTVGERVESLRSYALAHGCGGPLDLSRESLLPLWSWFLGRSEVARPPGGGPGGLSGESAALARDINVYLCEAVRSASWGRLSWGCVPGPRSLVGANMPALLGFAGGGFMPAGRDGASPNRVLERDPGTLQDAFGWEMTSVPGPGPWRPWGHWGVPLGRDLADTCALEGRLDDLLHRMGDPEVGEEALWTSSEDSRSWRAHREAEARGLRQEACLAAAGRLASAHPGRRWRGYRRAAYVLMGHLLPRRASEAHVSLYLGRLAEETDREVLMCLLDGMEDVPAPAGEDPSAVVRMAREGRGQLAMCATAALGSFDCDEARAELRRRASEPVGDRNVYVVERAVEGLGKVGLAGDLALVEGVAKTRRRDLRIVARGAADFIRNRALGE